MKIVVTGGRKFLDRDLLFVALDQLDPRPTLVIEGGQRSYDPKTKKPIGGADYWANRWAAARGIECLTVRADWQDLETKPVKLKVDKHGRRYNALAGPVRNARMVAMLGPGDVVCVTEGGTGTADCRRRAYGAGIRIVDVLAPASVAEPAVSTRRAAGKPPQPTLFETKPKGN